LNPIRGWLGGDVGRPHRANAHSDHENHDQQLYGRSYAKICFSFAERFSGP
jgi:hypothetical protein